MSYIFNHYNINALLQVINNADNVQGDIMIAYLGAIRTDVLGKNKIDWDSIDKAIQRRWSISAVESIRAQAYHIYKIAYTSEYRRLVED